MLAPSALDLSRFRSSLSGRNRLGRALWQVVWSLAFRPSPRPLHFWRRFLLRLFGAKLGQNVRVYSSARIWAPWNLQMDDYSCLGDYVDCYCVARVHIKAHSVVSQYSYLCTATHDYNDPGFPLVSAPITIGPGAWVAADVFIAPGVNVAEGAIVGARASVFRDVEPWIVAGGNPARKLHDRGSQGHKQAAAQVDCGPRGDGQPGEIR